MIKQPELHSKWEETARPGHTVEVIAYGNRWGIPTVTYKHVGVHKVRAQSYPTISETKRFLGRFVSID